VVIGAENIVMDIYDNDGEFVEQSSTAIAVLSCDNFRFVIVD